MNLNCGSDDRLPRLRSRRVRSGFTMIELLVVIGIIGILLALLLPAVQQARSSARRIECLNRLRQIGLGLHEFEATHGVFPAGKTSKTSDPRHPESSWLFWLLPFVEQPALFQSADHAFQIELSPYVNPPHTAIGNSVIMFHCPDDGRVDRPQSASSLRGAEVGLTSYLGVSGWSFRDSAGVLGYEAKTAIRDITDGTSNTLLIGERPPSPDFNLGWWYTGRGQDGTGNADMFMGVLEEVAEPTSRLTAAGCPKISVFSPGRINRYCDALHFWSLHAEGANWLYCDGSVRFTSYQAAEVLAKQATRAGDEVTTE